MVLRIWKDLMIRKNNNSIYTQNETTMKNLIALTLFFLASIITYGQSSVEKFHNKYREDRDATSVTITGGLFKLLGDIAEYGEDEDSEAVARIAKGINSLHVLSVPMFDSGLSFNEIRQLRADLASEKYEELMNVREGHETVNVLAQGSEDEVRNMIILVQDMDEFALINIDGRLSMKDLAYLAKHHKDWN